MQTIGATAAGREEGPALDAPIPQDTLDQLEEGMRSGHELGYFIFAPKHPRYRKGPGTTGDELLQRIAAGEYPPDEKCLHVDYIYGWFWQNCRRYYMAYRISGNAYYIAQLGKYAEGMDWILANRPQVLFPKGTRQGLGKITVDRIPWEPAAASNFIAHVYAARLTLDRARRPRQHTSGKDVQRARRRLETVVRYMESLVQRDGPRDEALGLPAKAAQIIRKIPWNQNMMYFAVLAGAAAALEDLQEIEGTDRYQPTIALYTRIVRAGVERFRRVSDVTEIDGRPYVFHSHHPSDPLMRSKEHPDGRIDGHPIFRYPEDVPHSQSTAWNLQFLWETGEQFGATERLLEGIANTHVDFVLKRTVTFEDGRTGPWNKIVSPWTERGRRSHPWGPLRRAGVVYVTYLTFNSELAGQIRAQGRRYSLRGKDRLFLLYARYIHATRQDRRLLHLPAPR